jgi:hypothetical protein
MRTFLLKVGFERVIRAVVNYVRALPSIDDFDKIGSDVFGADKDAKVKKLRESVKYYQVRQFLLLFSGPPLKCPLG